MRLCNEYRTAFKNVTDPASIAHLLEAGWREDTLPEPEKPEPEKPAVPAPVVKVKRGNPLMYKDRYLTQWLQAGKVDELRALLRYVGVEFNAKATKPELQALLREHIKRVKGEKKNDR